MPSRLKGIETDSISHSLQSSGQGLNVPSRLKGIETITRRTRRALVSCRLNVPSRLKGIETSTPLRTALRTVRVSKCAFPFEGN